MLTLDNYLQTASSLLGRSVTHWEGLSVVVIGIIISALFINLVASSLSEGRAEAIPSIVISAVVVGCIPLFYRGLFLDWLGLSEFMSDREIMVLSLACSALIVGTLLASTWFKMSFLSGIMTIIPFIVFWIMLIILLNQFGDALHSGGVKIESIRGRTVELNELMGD